MQQDAIQRVMEMQRIANERLQRTNAARSAWKEEHLPEPEPPRQESAPPPQSRRQPPPHGRSEGRGASPSPVHHAMPVELAGSPQEQPQESSQTPALLSSGALEGFIKRLGLETDQLILIGLLLLLINEGADTVLILAVFYLLI